MRPIEAAAVAPRQGASDRLHQSAPGAGPLVLPRNSEVKLSNEYFYSASDIFQNEALSDSAPGAALADKDERRPAHRMRQKGRVRVDHRQFSTAQEPPYSDAFYPSLLIIGLGILSTAALLFWVAFRPRR
jgi:hypothetical protein